MSQMLILPEDSSASPSNLFDVNGQQIDLRQNNSWTMRLHQVSTPELAEVFAINALAPFVLVARLKGMLAATASRAIRQGKNRLESKGLRVRLGTRLV